MATFLMIITSIAAILLIIIVLLQNSKGGGLDTSYGNVNQLGGVAQSTETIEKATWTLAGLIGILSLIAVLNYGSNKETVETDIDMNSTTTSVNEPVNNPTSPINNLGN